LLSEQDNDQFDLVHGNVLYPSAMQALQLNRTRGLPFLYTEHWTGYHRSEGLGIGLAGKLMIRHAAKKAAFLCPVSQHLAASMRSHGLKGNYKVIPNVVDTELFKPGLKTERFRFLHISSLVDEHKNISGMLRAIAKVLEKNKDLEFHLVGDGDPNPHLKYAKELNIPEDNLTISGEITLSQVAKKMAEAHAFLMFSHYENLPCVILEAFSCGIPVISSDTGGIRGHLDPSRGILVTNGMEDELERAILQVHRGYDDFNSEEIRQYAVENFSEAAISEQYTQLYEQMMAR
jgi:glycosyltransferase involved in cell wall biosynthesis